MVTEVVKELEAAKAKVIELESALQNELHKKLSNLPAEYGYADLASFIKALKQASGKRVGRRAAAGKVAKSAKRGKRTRITEEVKAKVKALIQDGLTGAAIAKSLGISLPSVHNIKKSLGLVKARG